jgi:hypothetical protein
MAAKTFYIELPPDASATLELAGRELGHYVHAVLGWESLSGKAPEAYRFRLGTRRTSFAFRTFLNQVMKALGDDGFRIVADGTTTTFCAETEKGVLNAAYSFLANVLRVRWAEPGALGEILPRRVVRPWWPMDVVETPAFAIRGMHVTEGLQWYREEDVRLHLEWLGRNRLNHLVVYANYSYERLRDVLVEECRRRGVTLEVEALAFDQFLPTELFDGRPEFFPVVDGARVAGPSAARCASSREAASLFVKNCIAWVRGHPEAEVVTLSPNDGKGGCECESCRAMKPNEQWSKFLCPALAALRSEFPERQFAARVGFTRYDPQEGDPECRLGVALMFDTLVRCPWHELGSEACDVAVPGADLDDAPGGKAANVYLLNVLREWKSISTGPVVILENVAGRALVSQPVVNPEAMSRDMITYRSMGLSGAVVVAHVHSFGSYLLNFNLFARLAWDLETNYRGLWPDLCVMYFGGYSFRVLDFVERLRSAEGRRLSPDEWQGLEALLGPVFEGDADVFTRRYRRVRESFLYMRELARLEDAGEQLRKARAEGNRAGALEAARAAHKSFLDAWTMVERNRLSTPLGSGGYGMFDTLDVLAQFIARGVNAETLADKFSWFPRPFRQKALWGDTLAALEAEGLSVDEICGRVEKEFADWRDRFAATAPRIEELVDDVDFGFARST